MSPTTGKDFPVAGSNDTHTRQTADLKAPADDGSKSSASLVPSASTNQPAATNSPSLSSELITSAETYHPPAPNSSGDLCRDTNTTPLEGPPESSKRLASASPPSTNPANQHLTGEDEDDCKCEHRLQENLFMHDVFELPDREWPVARILEMKMENGKRFYKVQWSEVNCLKTFLRRRNNGKCYVMIAGGPWDVNSYQETICGQCCMPMVKVNWKATWKRKEDLWNAEELIGEFHDASGLPTPPASDDDESIEVLQLRSQDNHDVAQSQEDVTGGPVEHATHTSKFQPQADVEYHGSDIREALSRTTKGWSRLLKQWTFDADHRSLTFCSSYVAHGLAFNLERGEKARGIAGYFCGPEPETPCESCKKGPRYFRKCIVSPFSTDGACADCQSGGQAQQCSFRVKGESIPAKSNAKLIQLQRDPSFTLLQCGICRHRRILLLKELNRRPILSTSVRRRFTLDSHLQR